MSKRKLLFVDTNIWLDFYRSRTDAGLSLLEHLEAVKDRIITTYQVEIEFKNNRQKVIEESMKALQPLSAITPPRIIADAKKAKSLIKNIQSAHKQVSALKARLQRALENPAANDPVYKICQRCFHKNDEITLSREHDRKRWIERKAFRRFLHGCPPRKKNDTSIDAINWEWIVECADNRQSEIHIVSRDADYGITIDEQSYLNDHLRQEFKERVSKKRNISLHTTLTQALKHFQVTVSKAEEKEETQILQTKATQSPLDTESNPYVRLLADSLLKTALAGSEEGKQTWVATDLSDLARHWEELRRFRDSKTEKASPD